MTRFLNVVLDVSKGREKRKLCIKNKFMNQIVNNMKFDIFDKRIILCKTKKRAVFVLWQCNNLNTS